MKDLLFLVHRIPYPPNKGDKIRSFHFLNELKKDYRIYLGAFIDDEDDWQYVDALEAVCAETFFLGLMQFQAKIKSLQGLLTGQALSLPFYRQKKFQNWVDEIIRRHNISKVLIFSSVMAQYIHNRHHVELVADFVDVDSDKWLQYSLNKNWPANWIYQREAKKLFEFERKVANGAKSTIFVSEREADLFKSMVPESVNTITYVNNGVDIDFFNPDRDYRSPYENEQDIIVFTGAMDYWANVDAVKWFAEEIFPFILAKKKSVKFYIVGSKPTNEVLKLADNLGVVVTGRVDEIRPYIAGARLVVAPLRIARGIQNKVLEAMAMGKHVFATPDAVGGIPLTGKEDVTVNDNIDHFAESIIEFLQADADLHRSAVNRAFVKDNFSWKTSAENLTGLLG
jgi:sugar transferase (PEP-CTERM/EpsH1 system associated)